MAAHTPGPWTILTPKDQEEDAYIIAEVAHIVVCNSPTKNLEPSQAAWPANARLIAAAPDLLEALVQCEDILSMFALLYQFPNGSATLEKARAAIAKATGEA